MNSKKVLFVFLMLVVSVKANYAQCGKHTFVFREGEKLSYKVSYNWGLIYLDAGKVSFEVGKTIFQGKKVFHFYSLGSSLPDYDWFFKVRDSWEAYSDTDAIRPLWFHRSSHEEGYDVENTYFFNHKNQKLYTWSKNTDKKLVRDTFNISPCLFDLITGLYYFRNLDFSSYKMNQKIALNFIIDNEIFPRLYARYLGIEEITLHNGTHLKCYKLKPYLVEGTIFSGGEEMTVWISTDGNNIPVLVEAKILVGSIKAELSDAKNLKHPLVWK